MTENNSKVWKQKAIVVLAVMLAFMAFVMILIGTSPHPKLNWNNGRLVLLEGNSEETITNTITVKIQPDGSRIDVLNISGRLYYWEFNRSSLLYEDINVSKDMYKNLFVSIGINGSEYKTELGNLQDGYVKGDIFTCNCLPILNDIELKLYCTYHFPTGEQKYQYIFKPEIRRGYIQ